MADPERPPAALPPVTRRGFLMTLGVTLSGSPRRSSRCRWSASSWRRCARSGSRPGSRWARSADFPEGQTRLATYRNPFTEPWDGETADIPCWVRRITGEKFQVFAINCAHLGCPVRWFAESRLFLCPCHGGVYYEDGSRASGPPPRGLYQYEYRVENGQLIVRGGELPTLSDPV